jgi:hypothetical protein
MGYGHALFGAMMFVLGAPCVHVANQLMVGHYLSGLLFSILALYGFVRALRSARPLWLVLGVSGYVLACACKEIYVPLPALLLLLREGTLVRRAQYALPYTAWCAVYLMWRYQVLGTLFGDRSGALGFDWAAALAQLRSVPLLLFSSAEAALAVGALGVLLLVQAIRGGRLNWPLWILSPPLLLLPLLPLTQFPGLQQPDRYLFLPWWALCTGFAWLLAQTGGRQPWWLVIAMLPLAAAAQAGLQQRSQLQPLLDLFDNSYRLALKGPGERILVPKLVSDPLYLDMALNQAISARHRLGLGPRQRLHVLFDPALRSPGIAAWEYEPRCGCLEPLPNPAPGQRPVNAGQRKLQLFAFVPPYPLSAMTDGGGRLDRCQVEGDKLRVAGWANLSDGDPEQMLVVFLPGGGRAGRLRRIERPDLLLALDRSDLARAGFEFTLEFPEPKAAQTARQRLAVFARSAYSGLRPISRGPGCRAAEVGSGTGD